MEPFTLDQALRLLGLRRLGLLLPRLLAGGRKPLALALGIAGDVARLRELICRSIFMVGFYFGGRHSRLAAAAGHGIAGAVGFYGRPPLEAAGQMTAAILALQAGDDANIPAEDNDAFDRAVTVEHEVVSLSRSISSACSPTISFSRAFSFSSAFNRTVSLGRIASHCARPALLGLHRNLQVPADRVDVSTLGL